MPTPAAIPLNEVRRRLLLDADGRLVWASSSRAAGGLSKSGYVKVRLAGKFYYAHRLIWALHYGEEPPAQIDHVNRVKHDNRVENLRAASAAENQRNVGRKRSNKSGCRGVYLQPKSGRWKVQVVSPGRKSYRGTFRSYDEACKVATAARVDGHGAFCPQENKE